LPTSCARSDNYLPSQQVENRQRRPGCSAEFRHTSRIVVEYLLQGARRRRGLAGDRLDSDEIEGEPALAVTVCAHSQPRVVIVGAVLLEVEVALPLIDSYRKLAGSRHRPAQARTAFARRRPVPLRGLRFHGVLD
jgi:hypothetical protein